MSSANRAQVQESPDTTILTAISLAWRRFSSYATGPFWACAWAIKTRLANSCFLLMPTSHAPLDRSAFSLSRCPKIRSRRKNRRELPATSYCGGQSASGPHHFSASGFERGRTAKSFRRGAYPCRNCTAICASGLCSLPGLRLSGEDVTPPHQQPTWPKPRRVSETLGVAARSSPDRPDLFRAPINAGKATWAGP